MNYQKEYEKIANAFVNLFKKDKNLIGITLNGGVSRGTTDEFSEIDIKFYVKDKKKCKNLPPSGDIEINGVWFEIYILELDKEWKEKWTMDKIWMLQIAKYYLTIKIKLKSC